MTTIGKFTRDGDLYTGVIITLTLNATATIKPVGKKAENAPDYRIYSAGAEIGAAWEKVSEAKKKYLSIKLDDPSFSQPILARLITTDEGQNNLVWNR